MNSANGYNEARKTSTARQVEFERLFAETPSAFATRIAAYLDNPVIEPEVAQNERAATKAVAV